MIVSAIRTNIFKRLDFAMGVSSTWLLPLRGRGPNLSAQGSGERWELYGKAGEGKQSLKREIGSRVAPSNLR